MTFKLPDLPYDQTSLEPYIDKKTMQLHHGKHHAGYVEKLNKALEGQKVSEDLNELLANTDKLDHKIRQAVINNGGGHANHSLFWTVMSPKSGQKPIGKLAEAIEAAFGDFEDFKEKFSEKALGIFGSGWAFLQAKNGKLSLKRHSFQNSPLMHGFTPILGLDVWEHAYYLKYQNRRADYIKAWWHIVNWSQVEENFQKALK